ncbi:hypothetical protein RJG79_04360 [Mycoplasmatota bacterium WC44]
MSDEKMRILEMIQNGTVTAEEGLELLNSVEKSVTPTPAKKGPFKMFKVRVLSHDGDKVNVQIPLSLARVAIQTGKGVNFGGNIKGVDFDQLGIDFEQIMSMIDEGTNGKFVDIESADGDIVEIWVE